MKIIDGEYSLTYNIPLIEGDSFYFTIERCIHMKDVPEGALIVGVGHNANKV